MGNRSPRIHIFRTGENIRRIMRCKGLSVKDIQEYLGMSTPQGVYHWICGRNLPTVDNLYALSELFDVPVDALLCGNRRQRYYFCSRPCYERFVIYSKKLKKQVDIQEK